RGPLPRAGAVRHRERPPGGGGLRAGASVQRPGGDPGRPRARDRWPLSRDPPSQLPRPAAGPVRLGPNLPERDRRLGLAAAAPAAGRADELRGGPARVGVRRAVRRLSAAHLAAGAVPLLSRSGRVRRRVTSILRATGRSPRPVDYGTGVAVVRGKRYPLRAGT